MMFNYLFIIFGDKFIFYVGFIIFCIFKVFVDENEFVCDIVLCVG